MTFMEGKLVLITGATSGIGYYTALELARMGARVVIHGRDETKCIAAEQSIQKDSHNDSVTHLLADFSSQAQVRRMAHAFLDQFGCLDVLINNAGAAYLFRNLSEDGLEMTFAVNHLAHFLLTNLLIPALLSSPSARVLNVSSGGHYDQIIDFDDLQLSHFYNPWKAYGRSKLANILFSNELARRLASSHVTSNALTPGMVATEIWKKINRFLTPFIYPIISSMAQTPLQGAQTSIYLASSPEVEGLTGQYYANKLPAQSSPASQDENTARHLWEVSAALTGLND